MSHVSRVCVCRSSGLFVLRWHTHGPVGGWIGVRTGARMRLHRWCTSAICPNYKVRLKHISGPVPVPSCQGLGMGSGLRTCQSAGPIIAGESTQTSTAPHKVISSSPRTEAMRNCVEWFVRCATAVVAFGGSGPNGRGRLQRRLWRTHVSRGDDGKCSTCVRRVAPEMDRHGELRKTPPGHTHG